MPVWGRSAWRMPLHFRHDTCDTRTVYANICLTISWALATLISCRGCLDNPVTQVGYDVVAILMRNGRKLPQADLSPTAVGVFVLKLSVTVRQRGLYGHAQSIAAGHRVDRMCKRFMTEV